MAVLLVAMLVSLSVDTCSSLGSVYLAATTTGTGSGNDCGNAREVSFFNLARNWGPGAGQIGPGTTVHLCGEFTVPAGETFLTCQGSGSPGAPVTILWELGARVTSPAMAEGLVCANQSWIVVDGGTNGTIRNTANGSSFPNHVDTTFLDIDGTEHVTIKNLNLVDVYVRTSLADLCQCGNAIQANSGKPLNDVKILNVKMTHSFHGILLNYQGASADVEIAGLACSEMDNCIFTGDRSAGSTFTGYTIHDSRFSGGANWDEPQTNKNHVEHIHLFGQNGGSVAGAEVYNNTFDGDCGGHCTAQLYVEGDVSGIRVYNNIFSPTGRASTNASLTFKGAASSMAAYNNTINCNGLAAARGIQSEGDVRTVTYKNNVIVNCAVAYENARAVTTVAGNNIYFNDACITTTDCSFKSWQATGHDRTSLNTNPGLDASSAPNPSGSAVVGAGENLSSLGIAALNLDRAGNPRPAGKAPWDVGALQLKRGGGTSGRQLTLSF